MAESVGNGNQLVESNVDGVSNDNQFEGAQFQQELVLEYKCGRSLNCHLLSCDKTKFANVGKMIVDMNGKFRSRKIDQMISHEMCAAAIEHNLPFKIVEYMKIKNERNYLNPDAIPITRNIAKSDVLKIYMR
ncbi:hypothetical protein TSUD_161100 [Trifolium subterraneum]|uniref:Uncharacterized protein n=1 Tax=Trifolium subterraneum TaxID=3900 RepID=A0A2Z6MBK0_TRISU|nr:hypothetical protein TSUD_161100 [Trifolium subterraneum]